MTSTVMATATMVLACSVLAGGVAVGHAAVASQRLAGAADAAALAAADAALGVVSLEPCAAAAMTAEHNGAAIEACDLDGATATVTVTAAVLGITAYATARAGNAAVNEAPGGGDGAHRNGELPADALSVIPWRPDLRLRHDAAASLVALGAAFRAEMGFSLPLTDAYRDLAGQVRAKEEWCARDACEFAAEPGTSTHGWGTAVDVGIGRTDWGSPVFRWLVDNAGRFGWRHPDWAGSDGPTPEAWHWEYG